MKVVPLGPSTGYAQRTVNDHTFEQRPDVKVCIPGTGARTTGGNAPNGWFGLSGAGAANWYFGDFLQYDGDYQMMSRHHNCAGVVRKALQNAGGEAYIQAPDCAMYAVPTEIEGWAVALDLRIAELNRRAQAFLTRYGGDTRGLRMYVPVDGGMPTRTEWHVTARRPDGSRGRNVVACEPMLTDIEVNRRGDSRESMTAVMRARRKLFEHIEQALGRDRDAYDTQVLRALGLRLLGELTPHARAE